MAIINGSRNVTKEKLKIQLNAEILAEMQNYCKWAGIDEVDYFVEEAISFVFQKDKDWKEHKRSVKRASKNQNVTA